MRYRSTPVSFAICVLLGIGALMSLGKVGPELIFATGTATTRPWTALTYPFFGGTGMLIGALLNGFTLWSFGRTIELEVGSAKYAVFAAISSVLAALGILIGSQILGLGAFLTGAWPLAAAAIVAWSIRYPKTRVRVMFVAEVEGKWLGIVAGAFTLLSATPYQVAPFSALGLLFAWVFAANKIPFFPYGRPLEQIKSSKTFGRGIQAPREGYFDEVRRREKEREERERLRKLFEGSMKDEDKP